MKYIKKSTTKAQNTSNEVKDKVTNILYDIKVKKDDALINYCKMFDGLKRDTLKVSQEDIDTAYSKLDKDIINDLKFAAEQIKEFAEIQKSSIKSVKKEVHPGIILGHRIIPVSSCAAYVPGGRYPLPSSALMSIIPAKVADVKRIVTCSPPDKTTGTINYATLVAMDIAGADEIYCMGGAHAIGALAYGTETISPVDIIVGPGNQWVTEAKRQVSGTTGIDFLAGPSEVLIIADKSANPDFIAADLLAQSEHDPQARGILITTEQSLGQQVLNKINEFLCNLKTAEIAKISWENNGEIILVDTLEEAVRLSNEICPEHLELHLSQPDTIIEKLINYGSLFIGDYAAEVFGDYVSGPNHILPTMRASKYTGGVYVGTFLKIVSFQNIKKEGAAYLAPVASRIAKLEGLYAHKFAADIRKDLL